MEANPNSGAAGFDHILFAATNIFQSITLEGWVDLMYMLQVRLRLRLRPRVRVRVRVRVTDLMYMLQVSRPGIAQVYFLLVVCFGAFEP